MLYFPYTVGGETDLEALIVDPGVPAAVSVEAALARQQDAAGVPMLAR